MTTRLPRTRRRLLLAPAGLLGVALVVVLAAAARGTWSDDSPCYPRAGAGPVAQVLRTAEGGREVRSATRLPFPLDEVWTVITDYENLGDVCTCVVGERIAHEPDGTCRVEARARSGLPGFVPFRAEMRHDRGLQRYVASWDESDSRVQVNRGRWEPTPAGPQETVVALSLEVEVRGVPTFVLRSLSLQRLPAVLRSLESRLHRGGPGKKW
jgi:hypothetical protein